MRTSSEIRRLIVQISSWKIAMLSRAPLTPVFIGLLSLTVLSATGCGGAEAPKDADARFDMGVVDEKLNNPREAAQFYQGTIDIDPQHVGARTKLARLYLLSGAPDRALDLISPAMQTHPDDPELLTIRAAARMQHK